MSTMDSLPGQALAHIIEWCPVSEREKLQTVSLKWKLAIEKYLGAFYITRGDASGIKIRRMKQPNGRKLGTLIYGDELEHIVAAKNNAVVANEARKTEAGDGADSMNNNLVDCWESKNRQFIQKLFFVGSIPPIQTGTLLQSCTNLSALAFHLMFLSELPSGISMHLEIPTLRTLSFDCSGVVDHWEIGYEENEDPGILFNWNNFFEKCISILDENRFPHLTTLVMDVPYCIKTEKAMYTSVSKFLSKHKETIKSFCFFQGFKIVPQNDEEGEEGDDENMETEEEDPEDISLGSLASSAKELQKVQLKELHVSLCCHQESDALWKNFLITQMNMEKLIFTGPGAKINFPTGTIGKCGQDLVTLILEIRDNLTQESVQALANCAKLKKLVLIGTKDEDDIPTVANAPDLSQLPLTLEYLTIHNLKLERQNSAQLLTNLKWKNLKEIELSQCGNEGAMGVTIQTLATMFQQNRFAFFNIASMNRKSLREEPVPCQLLAHHILSRSVSKFEFRGYLFNGHYLDRAPPKYNWGMDQNQDIFDFPEILAFLGVYAQDIVLGDLSETDDEETDEDYDDDEDEDDTEDEGGDA